MYYIFFSNFSDRGNGGPPSRGDGYGGPPRALNGGGNYERNSPWAASVNGGNNLMNQPTPQNLLPQASGLGGGHSSGPGSGGPGGPGKNSTQVTIPKDVSRVKFIFHWFIC